MTDQDGRRSGAISSSSSEFNGSQFQNGKYLWVFLLLVYIRKGKEHLEVCRPKHFISNTSKKIGKEANYIFGCLARIQFPLINILYIFLEFIWIDGCDL